jgi:hypothetical protein
MDEIPGKAILIYETDKGKIQENSEVLARKLQAGKQNRSFADGYECSCYAGLHLVGSHRPLIRSSHLQSMVCNHNRRGSP